MTLLDIPVDEDSLVRHYTLNPTDLLEIQRRRREHNQLGFAVQLCLMRYPGRPLLANEVPPKAMLDYVAEQVGVSSNAFRLYARREETHSNHISHLQGHRLFRCATPILHDELCGEDLCGVVSGRDPSVLFRPKADRPL